jgi:hypothetical protein
VYTIDSDRSRSTLCRYRATGLQGYRATGLQGSHDDDVAGHSEISETLRNHGAEITIVVNVATIPATLNFPGACSELMAAVG